MPSKRSFRTGEPLPTGGNARMKLSFVPMILVTRPIRPRRIWMPPWEAWQAPASALTAATGVMFYANVDWKIELREGLEVNVLVAPKSAGIHPEEGHDPRDEAKEAVRKDMVVQCARAGTGARSRGEAGSAARSKGQGCCLVDVDVIRMAVAANGIKGQNNVRLDLPDVATMRPATSSTG